MVKGLVSIIIPIYNKEEYLNSCIESVYLQTYKMFELLLIDDGSGDASGEISDAWAKKDDRIKVIHKKNEGVGSARNNGIDIACGEFLMFMDADDLMDERCLEIMLASVKSDTDLVVSAIKLMKKNKISSEVISLSERGEYLIDSYLKELVKYDVHYYYNGPFAKLIRNKFNKWKFRFELMDNLGEDFVFNMQLLREVKKIVVIDEPTYIYRIDSAGSLSKCKHKTQYYYMRYMIMYKELCATIKSVGCEKECYQYIKLFENKIVKLVARNIIFDPQYNGYFEKRKKLSEFREEYSARGFLLIQKGCGKQIKCAVFCMKHRLYLLLMILFKGNMLFRYGD